MRRASCEWGEGVDKAVGMDVIRVIQACTITSYLFSTACPRLVTLSIWYWNKLPISDRKDRTPEEPVQATPIPLPNTVPKHQKYASI
jgi:hypothetical protein